MGLQMAVRLQQGLGKEGKKVIAWNRTLSKTEPLTREGADAVEHAAGRTTSKNDHFICRQCEGQCSSNQEHQCGSTDDHSFCCADLAKHCSIIFTMLVDDQAVRSVVRAILEARPAEGTVLVECSTVSPSLIEELESRAQGLGCRLLSCPVFGRPDAVRAGNALFVCAGDPTAKQQVRSPQSIYCIVVAMQTPSSQVGCAGERANALQNSVNHVQSHQLFTGP